MTIIFLVVIITLKPFGLYSGMSFTITVLVALLVCLIPTTIGGLLSAIGIAGIDRMVQKNVLGHERPCGRSSRGCRCAASR